MVQLDRLYFKLAKNKNNFRKDYYSCLGMICNDCILVIFQPFRLSEFSSNDNWTLVASGALLAALLAHAVGLRGAHVGGLGVGPDHVALGRVAHLPLRHDPVYFG